MAEAAAAAAGPAAGAEAQHPAAELAVPAAAAGASSAGGFLRMRGLPFTSGEPDIRAFFAPFELAQVLVCKRNGGSGCGGVGASPRVCRCAWPAHPSDILLPRVGAGRSNGEAFVQLSDASQTSNALALLNRRTMGTRYIELFAASEGDLRTAESLGDNRLSRQHVVRLRGLPFNASPEDGALPGRLAAAQPGTWRVGTNRRSAPRPSRVAVLRFLSGVEIVRGLEGIIFTWVSCGARPAAGGACVLLLGPRCEVQAMP